MSITAVRNFFGIEMTMKKRSLGNQDDKEERIYLFFVFLIFSGDQNWVHKQQLLFAATKIYSNFIKVLLSELIEINTTNLSE